MLTGRGGEGAGRKWATEPQIQGRSRTRTSRDNGPALGPERMHEYTAGTYAGLRGDAELGEQARDALLLKVALGEPKVLLVLHDIRQHGAAEEHHVLATRGILDADLELL